MNVTTVTATAIKTLCAAIMLDHLFALAILDLLEMGPTVKIQTSVLTKTTIAIKILHAAITMDHLVAPAILDLLEMEHIVKI